MTDETNRVVPTASEAYFFFAILKHTKGKPDVNWLAVAEDMKLKNAEVAKVRFGQVRRKLGITIDGSNPATPRKGPITPSKVTKPTTPKRQVKKCKAEPTTSLALGEVSGDEDMKLIKEQDSDSEATI